MGFSIESLKIWCRWLLESGFYSGARPLTIALRRNSRENPELFFVEFFWQSLERGRNGQRREKRCVDPVKCSQTMHFGHSDSAWSTFWPRVGPDLSTPIGQVDPDSPIRVIFTYFARLCSFFAPFFCNFYFSSYSNCSFANIFCFQWNL